MSAPDTNLKTQEKRHRPSLIGIGAAIAIAAAAMTALLVWFSVNGDPPEGAAGQIDAGTGAPVSSD